MKYLSFEDMPVWNFAMDIAKQIFDITVSLLRSEDYGLTSQIRRSQFQFQLILLKDLEEKPDLTRRNFILFREAVRSKPKVI